ncbi:MAG: mechanosensitive ion channel [Mariprofundaceae bacterium]|nr:mechanosensitive ion channel [Mariprofundaceae bacterium]
MDAAKEGDFEKAAKYLDMRFLPKSMANSSGEKLAKKLKIVLDQKLSRDRALSKDEKGRLNDGLQAYRDLVEVIPHEKRGGRTYNILYQRVPDGKGHMIWKFSNKTVADIPKLYELYGYNQFEEFFAKYTPSFRLFDIESWLWVMALIILLISITVIYPVCKLLLFLVDRRKIKFTNRMHAFVNGPVRLILIIYLAHSLFITYFHLSSEARAITEAGTFRLLIISWFLIKAANILQDYWTYRLKLKGAEKADEILLRPIATLVKYLIGIIALLVWLSSVGYDISALLAGLGIGGLAFALGAQKSLENLIGTITIYATSPIKIGDWCSLGGGVEGSIEEIGFWATQVRTLDRSVVFVPNGQLAAGTIENFSLRDRFHFLRTLYLEHKTPKKKIEQITASIRTLLEKDERVDDSICRITLNNIGEFGFEVTVQTLIDTTVLDESKKVIADLNLAINQIIQNAGVTYAVPLRPVAE